MSQASDDRIGDVIDRYRIERLLGAGGFGSVYVAQHIHMQRSVALKLLHGQHLQGPKGREMRDRFLREAQAAAAIGHPSIVQVYDSGVAGEDTFVAMELLEGEDLDSYLTREGTVPATSAVAFILRLLEAVGAAHQAGIVHRDLKPANIFLVTEQTGGPLDEQPLKLLDFGISKVRGANVESLTRTGAVMGTPHYMAPEMFLGVSEVDGRADLYAVAAILYEMLTGGPPHKATSYEHLVVQVATTPAQSLSVHRPDLSRGLVDVVDRCLKTDPAKRFDNAEAFAKALAAADMKSISMSAEDMLGETAMDLSSSAQAATPADSASRTPSEAESGASTPPSDASTASRWLPMAAAVMLVGIVAFMLRPEEQPNTSPDAQTMEPTAPVQVVDPEPAPLDPATLDPATPTAPVAEVAPLPEVALPEPAMVERAPRMTERTAPSAMNTSTMIAAPPTMSAVPASPMNVVMNAAPETAPSGEGRPRRIRVPCGPGSFQSDAYLAGPQTSIRLTSARQNGVTESTTVLRQTVATKARRILRCYGREPIALSQGVNFHVGPGGVVSNVVVNQRCPIAPRVVSCLVGVFESVDFSSVQQGEGDAQVGFSPAE